MTAANALLTLMIIGGKQLLVAVGEGHDGEHVESLVREKVGRRGVVENHGDYHEKPARSLQLNSTSETPRNLASQDLQR